VSKSTGMLNSPNASGAVAGKCTIARLSVPRLQIEEVIDMTSFGDEIYDLLPIEGTEHWPFVSGVEFRSSDQTREDLIDRTAQAIASLIPDAEPFILVDQEVFRNELAAGRRAIPFLERDGRYWGVPSDDATAIEELKRLRRSGASFIVFGWPALWWLDYYSRF